MKKYFFVFLFVLCIFVVAGCTQKEGNKNESASNEEEKTIQIVQSMGNLPVIFENVEDLETVSETIIEAKYTGETVRAPYPVAGEPDYKVTLSKVIVKKSHKGELKKRQEIWISEPGDYSGEDYTTISGYKNMDKKGRYVLFLRKYDELVDGKEAYVVTGGHQGKYDLNLKKKAKHKTGYITQKEFDETEYFGDLAPQFNEMKEQVVEKYGEEAVTE